MDIKEVIGKRINHSLVLRDKKQKELAKTLNVKDNTISYFCSGKRSPQLHQIPQIAESLNVSTDFLLGLTDDPSPQKSAVDELGLSPKVIDKIKKINSQTSSDCNPIAKINRLLEDEEVWTLLFEIHDYITAVKADSIYESLLAEGYTQEEISAKIQEVADTYKDTDIDMFDFLTAKAHSHSSRPLIRLGLEESSICDLISMRINHQLYRLLLNIEKEETHGID